MYLHKPDPEIIMADTSVSKSVPNKILVPIDFSSSSHAALDMAADLARHFHAALYLLNVIPMFPINTGVDYYPEDAVIQGADRYAKERLAALVEDLRTSGLEAEFDVQIGNDVVGNILMVIEREHLDMVVLSTHGTSGWRAVLFGSIAEKVVRLVQCPVMLLHTPKPAVCTEQAVHVPHARAFEAMVL